MKQETYAEYLARGGKVTRIPSQERRIDDLTVRSTQSSHAISKAPKILSLSEGGIIFGKSSKKTKKVNLSKIDLTVIPEELKRKLGL